jgi:hypothetical protein
MKTKPIQLFAQPLQTYQKQSLYKSMDIKHLF